MKYLKMLAILAAALLLAWNTYATRVTLGLIQSVQDTAEDRTIEVQRLQSGVNKMIEQHGLLRLGHQCHAAALRALSEGKRGQAVFERCGK